MKRVNSYGSDDSDSRSSSNDLSLGRYTSAENEQMQRNLMHENQGYQPRYQSNQNNNQQNSTPHNPQEQSAIQSANPQQNPYLADKDHQQHKEHRKHKIELWIASITAVATIIGVGFTYLGYKQNQRKQLQTQPRTEKIYHDKSTAPKPKVKTRTKIKKVIEKPKKNNNNQAEQQREQKLRQEANDAKQQARQSAREASQKANEAEQKTERSAQPGGKLHQAFSSLKNKLRGYEQRPSSGNQNQSQNN